MYDDSHELAIDILLTTLLPQCQRTYANISDSNPISKANMIVFLLI